MKTFWVCRGCGERFDLESAAKGTACERDLVEVVDTYRVRRWLHHWRPEIPQPLSKR